MKTSRIVFNVVTTLAVTLWRSPRRPVGARTGRRGSGYRNLYWVIRNTRRGIHDAKRRRVYYEIAEHKKTPAHGRRVEGDDFGLATLLPDA